MKTGETEFRAERSAVIAATAAVAATYVYFLLFAELALLELARPLTEGTTWRGRGLFTCLGVGGLVGCGLAVWRCNVVRWQAQLSWGFRACAVAAALALAAGTWWGMWLVVAGLVGATLGWLTVILVSGLRATVGTVRLGWVVGLGTGLAYAICNLPGVVDASARTQTIVVAFVAGAGSLLAPFLTPREPSVSLESDYRILGFGRWVLMLLVLVWLDAVAHHVIQREAGLQPGTGAGSGRVVANAVIHLLLAVGAGWWLDRGGRMSLIAVALGLLVAGCLALNGGMAALASLAYAAGVSIYAVVLVYYPARGGRATQAGGVLVVAGGLGAALGSGMARELEGVPGWFLAVAVGVIALMGTWRWLTRRGEKLNPTTT